MRSNARFDRGTRLLSVSESVVQEDHASQDEHSNYSRANEVSCIPHDRPQSGQPAPTRCEWRRARLEPALRRHGQVGWMRKQPQTTRNITSRATDALVPPTGGRHIYILQLRNNRAARSIISWFGAYTSCVATNSSIRFSLCGFLCLCSHQIFLTPAFSCLV